MNKEMLTSAFISAGYSNNKAKQLANDLCSNENKYMINAIFWGVKKFGQTSPINPDKIRKTMFEDNLNPFQAIVKLNFL